MTQPLFATHARALEFLNAFSLLKDQGRITVPNAELKPTLVTSSAQFGDIRDLLRQAVAELGDTLLGTHRDKVHFPSLTEGPWSVEATDPLQYLKNLPGIDILGHKTIGLPTSDAIRVSRANPTLFTFTAPRKDRFIETISTTAILGNVTRLSVAAQTTPVPEEGHFVSGAIVFNSLEKGTHFNLTVLTTLSQLAQNKSLYALQGLDPTDVSFGSAVMGMLDASPPDRHYYDTEEGKAYWEFGIGDLYAELDVNNQGRIKLCVFSPEPPEFSIPIQTLIKSALTLYDS